MRLGPHLQRVEALDDPEELLGFLRVSAARREEARFSTLLSGTIPLPRVATMHVSWLPRTMRPIPSESWPLLSVLFQTISLFAVNPQARTTSYASGTIELTRQKNMTASSAMGGSGMRMMSLSVITL